MRKQTQTKKAGGVTLRSSTALPHTGIPANRKAGTSEVLPGKRTFMNASGEEMKKESIYIPAALAAKLRRYCMETGRSLVSVFREGAERVIAG